MFLFFYECIFLSCCRFGLHAYGTMAAVSTTSYLCGLCKLPVKHGDKALQCEGDHAHFGFTAIAFLVVKSITHNTRKLLLLMKLGIVLTVLVDHQLPPFNTVNAIDVFHFEYQKNLPIPKLTAGKQFYLRLLWTYNFGVYCASRDALCAFMCNELVAHCGANSVVSCLMKLIFSTCVG